MRCRAIIRSSSTFTSALLLTLTASGCVSTVDGGGSGGSGGESSGDPGTAGGDCGDTEATSVGVTVGVGGDGTSAVAGVGGWGTSVSATSSSSAVGAGGSSCGSPPPVGPLEFCGGSASAGSGMASSCTTFTCDQNGDTWDQTCDESGLCTCTYNSQPVCACLGDPAQVCAGGGCCPAPWSS